MKKHYLSSSFLFAMLCCLISCSGSDEPTSTAKEQSSKASINNVTWTSDTVGANFSNGKISFFARSNDLSSITFLVVGTEKGKYPIQYGSSGNFSTFSPDKQSLSNPLFSNVYPGQNQDQVGGDFTITEMNTTEKWITGTFQVKLSRVIPKDSLITISKGSFNKVKYSEGTAVTTTNTFSAKVDGGIFSPELIGAVLSNQKIVINASINGQKSVGITVPATIAPGTFNLGSIGSTYAGTYIIGSDYYVASTGKLVVTKHDKTAKLLVGTFNFTAEDMMMSSSTTVAITEGTFSVKYQ